MLLRSLAFVLSLVLLTAAWIGIGFFGTGQLMELAYGPWEGQPIGSGLALLFAMTALVPLYLFGIYWLIKKLTKLFGATQVPPIEA